MARNQEKAQSMLNRWVSTKRPISEFSDSRRPEHPAECLTLKGAEHWRRQLLKDIAEKVSIIQNASLGEHRLRDLNDEINRMINEKLLWELRIMELNGPDYRKQQPKLYDDNGEVILITPGYKYFGAARELPGVKELFEKNEAQEKPRSRAELYEGIDADYYGFGDKDDTKLALIELEAEEKARQQVIDEYNKSIEFRKQKSLMKDVIIENSLSSREELQGFVAHVDVPSLEQVEQMLVQRRKEELLKKLSAY
jgi:pre-mRNA-splicing factor ISY1